MESEYISGLDRSRNRTQRRRVQLWAYQSSSEDESSVDSQSVTSEAQPDSPSFPASEVEVEAPNENSACDLVIISVHGLNERHHIPGDFGFNGPDGSVRRIYFDFKRETIIGEKTTDQGIRDAASELLSVALEQSDAPAFVFLASDLGGSVLKQALVEASREPRYLPVLRSTALLVFYGTPHRAPRGYEWSSLLGKIVHDGLTDYPGPWLPSQLQRLSVFHLSLAEDFDAFLQMNTPSILSIYQEESDIDAYNLVLPKSAATLGHPAEASIGLKRPHHILFHTLYREHILNIKLLEVKYRFRPEFQKYVHMLSNYGLGVPTRPSPRAVYKTLCDWVLSDVAFLPWLDNMPLSSREYTESSVPLSPMPNNVSRAMITLELNGNIKETSIITSSLIAAIQSRRAQKPDKFIALTHHYPQPVSLSKAQLLASLCRQILTQNPALVDHILPLYDSTERAVAAHNSTWKETCLWKLLRTLLTGWTMGQTFIIINVPTNTTLQAAFLDLIKDITDFVKSTEIHYKVMVLRGPPPKFDIVEPYPLVRKSLSHEDLEAMNALRKDFTDKFVSNISHKPRLQGFLGQVVELLLQEGAQLQLGEVCLAMVRQHIGLSLNLIEQVLSDGSDRKLATLILDLVPSISYSWLLRGLAWVTCAVRPLTRAEFQEALALPNGPGGSPDSLAISLDEFAGLLDGLVEVEGDTIYITNPGICEELCQQLHHRYHSGLRIAGPNSSTNPEEPQYGDNGRWQSQMHLDIAQASLAYLFKAQGVQVPDELQNPAFGGCGSSPPAPVCSEAPLLAYAAEHWFTHLKLSRVDRVFTELADIVDFFKDEDRVHQWMQWRTLFWKSTLGPQQNYAPLLATLPEKLSLQTSNDADIFQLIHLALDASTIEEAPSPSPSHSLVLAAAQRGQTELLQKFVDEDFLQEDETLRAVFETGFEETLCSILPKIRQDWIHDNIQCIIHGATLGSYALVHCLPTEFQDLISYENYEISFLYTMAESMAVNPPDRLWEDLKSSIGSTVGGERVLNTAASAGHSDLISKLLSADPAPSFHVDSQDASRSTPLHLASNNGHIIVAEQLLAAGAGVSIRDKDGQTPLHLACASGHIDIAKMLISHKASIGLNDKKSRTPLHRALGSGHQELCQILLDQIEATSAEGDPFDLDSRDINGLTPLLLAVKANCLAAVKRLLKLGANVNISCKEETSALHYATRLSFQDIVPELLQAPGIIVNAPDETSATPLHYSAASNEIGILKQLKENNADCEARNSAGRSPLASACVWDNVAAVKTLLPGATPGQLENAYYTATSFDSFKALPFLLSAGVDINTTWEDVGTSLHVAAYNSQPGTVRLLLMRGADLEARDNNKRTPLIDAVRRDSVECVRLLVDAGANLEAEGDDDYTPLLHAASEGHSECIQILFEGNVEFKVPSGMSFTYTTPMDMALYKFETKSFEMVVDRMLAQSSSLSLSPDSLRAWVEDTTFDVKKVQILLEKAADWDPNGEIGRYGTMLHYAALWGKLDLTRLLIDSPRVQMDAITEKHGTPLEIASGRGAQLDIVELLLQRGASITAGSRLMGTPMHAAASMPKMWEENAEETYLTIAKAILELDSSALNVVAGRYGTPLCAAATSGTLTMVKTLLKKGPNCKLQGGTDGTALHAAAKEKRVSIVQALLDHMSPELAPTTTDAAGRLPIHMAACGGEVKLIDILAVPEALLLTRDLEGRHSLHYAAGGGSLDFVRRLLEQYPEAVNDVDCDGWSPLHWACRQKSLEVVELLLNNNAEIRAKTKKGWLPVHVAIYHGLSDIAEIVKTAPLQGIDWDPVQGTNAAIAGAQEKLVPTPQIAARSDEYSIYDCDSCFCRIYGPRRCCSCHWFDLCFKCYRQGANFSFKGHHFNLFTPLGDKLAEVSDSQEAKA